MVYWGAPQAEFGKKKMVGLTWNFSWLVTETHFPQAQGGQFVFESKPGPSAYQPVDTSSWIVLGKGPAFAQVCVVSPSSFFWYFFFRSNISCFPKFFLGEIFAYSIQVDVRSPGSKTEKYVQPFLEAALGNHKQHALTCTCV